MKNLNFTHMIMTQKQEFLDVSEKLKLEGLDLELGLTVKEGEDHETNKNKL